MFQKMFLVAFLLCFHATFWQRSHYVTRQHCKVTFLLHYKVTFSLRFAETLHNTLQSYFPVTQQECILHVRMFHCALKAT